MTFVAEFSQTNSFKTKPEIFLHFSKNDRNPTGGFRNDTADLFKFLHQLGCVLNQNCAVDNGRKPLS